MQDWEQEALDSVNEALADFQQLTWTKLVDGAPADPNAPWVPGAPVKQDFKCMGLVLPSNRKGLAALFFMAGTEIPAGYQRGLLSGDCGFTPALKDKVTDVTGQVYSVEWIDCLKPAGNPLLWYLGLKP